MVDKAITIGDAGSVPTVPFSGKLKTWDVCCALSTHLYHTASIRVVTIDGNPWFVAKDVCDVLGYSVTVSATLTKHVHDDDRRPFDLNTLPNREPIRGNPRVSVINKSGLFSLTMGSKRPEAKVLKHWVTSVVLPAIEKDGAYIMGEEKVATGELSEDEFFARAVQIASRKLDRLSQEKAALEVKVAMDEWPSEPAQQMLQAKNYCCGNRKNPSEAE